LNQRAQGAGLPRHPRSFRLQRRLATGRYADSRWWEWRAAKDGAVVVALAER